jgi:hypothetical protein
MSDWMTETDIRKQVVVASLESRSLDLRRAAAQCRKAYTKDYMNIPMNWLADAYDEAAAILDARLATASSVSQAQSKTP